MIITCENCLKKFNLEDSLIPDDGRELQCGSCNHKWFFKKIENTIKLKDEVSKNISNEDDINNNYIDKQKSTNVKKQAEVKSKDVKITNKSKKIKNSPKIVKNSLVFIISIIALIILLDTFKFQLNNYVPGLDSLLNNLYESLKDVSLFIIDLIN
tara:strand:- start:418 stop:882 length:465 start_codon:yes stop_codon:yes gene_type:complete